MRTRAERRYSRYVKKMRRLRENWAQHAAQRFRDPLREPCPCTYDAKTMAMFADTPRRCSCWLCGNLRRVYGNRRGALSVQELKALEMSDTN